MRLRGALGHLTYCSNIHPGETWDEVRGNLERYLPKIRASIPGLDPGAPLGIGLRLSAAAVQALSDPAALGAFREFLSANGFYVFTLNGFPYGPFHGTRVKEDVYLPDWKDPERLRYTNQLADVFAQILPAQQNTGGTISTVPGAFKANVVGTADRELMCDHIVDHVAHLVSIHRRLERQISLVLEPEPCCFLETIDESVRFFQDYLFAPRAIARLAAATRLDSAEASRALHRHLGLCLDLCHAAVEFEDPAQCITQLRDAGITIGKVQISSGLRLTDVDAERAQLLEPFNDAVYLHQVVERCGDEVTRFVDLDDAFASLQHAKAYPREWRVHFHVPIFLDDMKEFSSTRFFIEKILEQHRNDPISEHLEVETYTWNVLPEIYRNEPMDKAIARELTWVLERCAL